MEKSKDFTEEELEMIRNGMSKFLSGKGVTEYEYDDSNPKEVVVRVGVKGKN